MSKLNSKRFVLRKSLVGQNQIIEVTFKNGNQVTYNHDKVYELMKDKLETMNCWEKYKSYTSSGNVPKAIRETEAIISQATTEVVVDEVVEETEDITSEEMTLEGAF